MPLRADASYYYITVERVPHDQRTREYFDYHCYTDDEARDYARSVAKLCGPDARVVSVEKRP